MTRNLPFKESPSQTAGPYVHIGCTPNVCGIDGLYEKDLGALMICAETKGARITIRGRVLDGSGAPLSDALIEIWQADAAGLYPGMNDGKGAADPNFNGWGRQACDPETGVFQFETIKPGAVSSSNGLMQAPHISFWIAARGINVGLNTRLYFPDENNDHDPVLKLVDKARRSTLVAVKNGDLYHFTIQIQGENETVFFDI